MTAGLMLQEDSNCMAVNPAGTYSASFWLEAGPLTLGFLFFLFFSLGKNNVVFNPGRHKGKRK
jgi:hypothetical protein